MHSILMFEQREPSEREILMHAVINPLNTYIVRVRNCTHIPWLAAGWLGFGIENVVLKRLGSFTIFE